MTRTLNRDATPGYRDLMGLARIQGSGDPWGSNVGMLFAIAEVVLYRFDDVMPDYRPSPIPLDDDHFMEDWPSGEVLHMVDRGAVTEDDLRAAYTVFSRYDEWLRLAGMNY